MDTIPTVRECNMASRSYNIPQQNANYNYTCILHNITGCPSVVPLAELIGEPNKAPVATKFEIKTAIRAVWQEEWNDFIKDRRLRRLLPNIQQWMENKTLIPSQELSSLLHRARPLSNIPSQKRRLENTWTHALPNVASWRNNRSMSTTYLCLFLS